MQSIVGQGEDESFPSVCLLSDINLKYIAVFWDCCWKPKFFLPFPTSYPKEAQQNKGKFKLNTVKFSVQDKLPCVFYIYVDSIALT